MADFGSSEAGKRGGEARARKLTKEERSEIARKAAAERWNADIPRAKYEGVFNIGDIEVSAAVLSNGKRLLTQATFLRALGRSRSPKAGTGVLSTVDGIPFFLQAEALKPFISEELLASTTPIFFIDLQGRKSVGYDAELLPAVAEVYLAFRDSLTAGGKPVPTKYQHIITACDIVMRGLARVGIIALVDEATGAQDDRAKNALALILEKFVAEEIRKYVKTFPLTYYRELCRIRGVPFSGDMKLPSYFGHLTNDLIYARLAPGVLGRLQEVNPRENGRRKAKHFQHLTEDVGNPKLLMHLGQVIGFMRQAKNWKELKKLVDQYLPVYRDMPLFKEFEDES